MCEKDKTNTVLKTPNKATSSLHRHAKNYHKKDYSKAQESETEKQPTIGQFLAAGGPYPRDSQKKKARDRELAKMVCTDLQPLSIVNDKGFNSLVRMLDPRWKLPSRGHLSGTLLKELFNDCKLALIRELKKADHVAITTDMWTSCAVEAYMAVTCHYWSQMRSTLEARVLDCPKFEGEHTAAALQTGLAQALTEFNIADKIVAAVSDSAHNIQKALTDAKLPHFPCFAHTINLVATNAIRKTEQINLLREKLSSIISLTRRSTKAWEKFEQCQKNIGRETVLKLILDVPTRWNSTFLMLERLVDLKEAVKLFIIGLPEDSNPMMMTQDWIDIEEIITVLKPLYDVTNEMSTEKRTSVSKIVPLSKLLTSFYTTASQKETGSLAAAKLASNILHEIVKRLSGCEQNGTLAKASMLDPSFKKFGFMKPQNIVKATTWLSNEGMAMIAKRSSGEENTECDSAVNEKESNSLWGMFEDEANIQGQAVNNPNELDKEMNRYFLEPKLERDRNPLEWWTNTGKQTYPNLFQLAMKYLVVPATSVPSERVFSTAGEVLSKKRNRLGNENATMIIMTHSNLDLID